MTTATIGMVPSRERSLEVFGDEKARAPGTRGSRPLLPVRSRRLAGGSPEEVTRQPGQTVLREWIEPAEELAELLHG
jgi:hypothetical protein